MADSLTTIDCADVRRFWSWTHPNSDTDPVAGLTLSLGYQCVTDVCLILTDDSGPMPLVLGTDYTVDLDAGTVTFIVGGATSFFISDTTVITAWFNTLQCIPSVPCVTVPCCDESDSYFPPYVTERKTNCFPVATVSFAPVSGSPVIFPISVTLSTNRSDAVIHYTTDGSQPTVDSPIYSAAIPVSSDADVICALAVVPECDPGPVSCAQYVTGITMDGLIGWYVGSDYDDATGWPDRSGLANKMDTINGGYHKIASALNGNDIIRCTSHGTAQRTAGSFTIGGTRSGYSVVVVRRRTSTAFLAALYVTTCNDASSDESIHSSISGTVDTLIGQGVGDTSATHDIVLNEWNVLSFTFDNTEKVARLYSNNQKSVGGVSSGTVPVTVAFTQDGAGEVAEMVCYRRKLSDTELANVRQALAFKYGLSITV